MPNTSSSSNAVVTRFAPSPSGHLHLGHAYSALFAYEAAAGGKFLLRIEDIDLGRCRPAFEESIKEDLAWLGLIWEEPVRRQSEHMTDYAEALERLEARGLLYPCFCTRKDILAEIESAAAAPHDAQMGPDGPIYPGICRRLSEDERRSRIEAGEAHALRLDMATALAQTTSLSWTDLDDGLTVATPEIFGDVVLARKDTPTSYHLSVTVDDHLQGITLISRGEDLRAATHVHRLLQALLGYVTPDYRFHRLLTGVDGRRYAKRDKSLTLRELRAGGETPESIRVMVGV
jgi:glutamyl-Q tRNA(Asp) synthetase